MIGWDCKSTSHGGPEAESREKSSGSSPFPGAPLTVTIRYRYGIRCIDRHLRIGPESSRLWLVLDGVNWSFSVNRLFRVLVTTRHQSSLMIEPWRDVVCRNSYSIKTQDCCRDIKTTTSEGMCVSVCTCIFPLGEVAGGLCYTCWFVDRWVRQRG